MRAKEQIWRSKPRRSSWPSGATPRINQNTLVFLAADRSRLDELEQAARYYLAWQSIMEQETELNLDKSQSRQATTQKATWDRTTTSRIGETFQ